MIAAMPECGGCRTCEMACSFHHTGLFKPSVSSIQILDKRDIGGYEVRLLEEADGDRLACDGCEGLSVPLCIEYCKEAETLEGLLRMLRRESGSSTKQ